MVWTCPKNRCEQRHPQSDGPDITRYQTTRTPQKHVPPTDEGDGDGWCGYYQAVDPRPEGVEKEDNTEPTDVYRIDYWTAHSGAGRQWSLRPAAAARAAYTLYSLNLEQSRETRSPNTSLPLATFQRLNVQSRLRIQALEGSGRAARGSHTCLPFCTKHNGRQLGSKVFICNKLDVSKHPRSTLQHVMLNAAAMYRPVQCPAVNTQYYMIYYYISLWSYAWSRVNIFMHSTSTQLI